MIPPQVPSCELLSTRNANPARVKPRPPIVITGDLPNFLEMYDAGMAVVAPVRTIIEDSSPTYVFPNSSESAITVPNT